MILIDSDSLTLAYYERAIIKGRVDQARTEKQLFVPLTVHAEILIGRLQALIKATDAEQLLKMQDRYFSTKAFLDGIPVLKWDAFASRTFELLKSNRRLRKVGHGDLLIAAMALSNQATLVTCNLKDYSQIPGLTTEDWTRSR